MIARKHQFFGELPVRVLWVPLARKLLFHGRVSRRWVTSERIGSAATEPGRDSWPQTEAEQCRGEIEIVPPRPNDRK